MRLARLMRRAGPGSQQPASIERRAMAFDIGTTWRPGAKRSPFKLTSRRRITTSVGSSATGSSDSSTPIYDGALGTLRRWPDSWAGIGYVTASVMRTTLSPRIVFHE